MEKNTPHHRLAEIKRLISEGCVVIANMAIEDAKILGFNRAAILETVLGLDGRDFYKSMTAYRNHRLWLDVYRPQTNAGAVYLKLTVEENVVIISFKEL